jgi:hypothetical protein
MAIRRITPAPTGTVPIAALGHALELVRIAAGLAKNCRVTDPRVLADVLAVLNAAAPAAVRLAPDSFMALAKLGLQDD